MPVSSYQELIRSLEWDTAKRSNEHWYIFLVMNPMNQTNAGIDIIKNFSYLNERTGNVTFFLPGFSNTDDGVVPCESRRGCRIVYEDDSFGKVYFDERGFLDTVKWLEGGSSFYHYNEDLDLVIVKYCPRFGEDSMAYENNFDLENMVVYNLDTLKRKGINTLRMITECMRVVPTSISERDVRHRLDNYIFGSTGISDMHWHQNIKVFVAGAKSLKTERDAVISALTHITNRSSRDYAFRVQTYEDFGKSLTNEGRQKEYNDYISNEADYAIFILDNNVGGITFEEFNIALEAYKQNRRPDIYVYSRIPCNEDRVFSRFFGRQRQSEEIEAIRKHLSSINQYYIEYKDIDDLKNHILQDFRRYGI